MAERVIYTDDAAEFIRIRLGDHGTVLEVVVRSHSLDVLLGPEAVQELRAALVEGAEEATG